VCAIDLFYSADELSALLADLGFAGIYSEAVPGYVIARHRAVSVWSRTRIPSRGAIDHQHA
jgi:hypothetical protein